MTRMRLLLALLALAGLAAPMAATASPVVSNVAFTQQPDGNGSTEILVNYDLVSADGPSTVTLLYSAGAGFLPASTTTGNVGAGQTTGTGKSIRWAVADDISSAVVNNVVVRVLAADSEPIPVTVTSSAPSSIHQVQTQTITFQFAEAVEDFTAADVLVTGASKGTFTAVSASQYTLELVAGGGQVVLNLPADAAHSVGDSSSTTAAASLSNFYQDTWTITLPGAVTMELIRIPAGSYTMGAPTGELNRGFDETQHQVTLSADFYLSKSEVTQQQWAALASFPQAQTFTGATMPVHNVSWTDAVSWIAALDTHVTEAATFGLPTEGQWEYACRAGTTTRFNFGDGLHPTNDESCTGTAERNAAMWFCGNSGSTTQPVTSKPANGWGLYGMHGNVWEWCSDLYGSYGTAPVTDPTGAASGTDRVVRGGSWVSGARFCRSGQRLSNPPGDRFDRFGFRVMAIR